MSSPSDPSRDLLFGLLALQNGLIDQGTLFSAFAAWTRDRGRSLPDHLADLGRLDGPRRAALEAIAALHLEALGGDPSKSLVAAAIGRSAHDGLAHAGRVEIDATRGYDGQGRGPSNPKAEADADLTGSYAAGPAGSDGQRFRILRPHARGGLGAVFVALDSDLDREVAVKQILEDHADDAISRIRFLIEARITGGLEHPGIVPVYGLGTDGDGRPYYAMRLVRGESLKEAIDRFHGTAAVQNRSASGGGIGPGEEPAAAGTAGSTGSRDLRLRKLLGRFLDVCNAVEYAHSRGVLHRDLKPANIIVGKHGETLVVDWGLAKPTGSVEPAVDSGERMIMPSSASGSSETLPGTALGTPAYMSPEQAEGRLDRIGTRSDVYSLGATLYCLLTGRPPFDGEALDVLRAVERGAFRPPRELDPRIDPALEAICLTSMAHRPEDRYPSCRALADDVERWMADEPISAWREPLPRRARRWARRNRPVVTAVVAALVVGVVGLSAVLAVQTGAKADLAASLRRETSAGMALSRTNAALNRSRAAVQARYDLAVEAIRTFYTGVSEDFLLKQEPFKDVRDRLLRSASDFYGRLAALLGGETDLASRRALWQANFEVAELTGKVGKPEDALASHRQVLAGRRALADEDRADVELRAEVGRSLIAIARLLEATGRTREAETTYREAESLLVELAASGAGAASARAVLANCRSSLGWLLHTTGRDDLALAICRLARADQEALAAAPGATAGLRWDLAATTVRIALMLAATGRSSEAEAEYRNALEIQRTLADDHPAAQFRSDLAQTHNNLGNLLSSTGRPSQAADEYRKALAFYRTLADDHPAVAQFRGSLALSHNNLGIVLADMGRSTEAAEEYREAVALYRKLVDEYPDVTQFRSALASGHGNLGNLLSRTGRSTEAAGEYREALALYQKLADDNPAVTEYRSRLALSHNNLGIVLAATGRSSDVEAEYRRALEIQRTLADDHPATTQFRSDLAQTHNNLGNLMLRAGRASEAEAEYRRALRIQQGLADGHPAVTSFRSALASSHNNLGLLLMNAGRSAEAEAEYRLALDLQRKLAGDHPAVAEFRGLLASSHSNLGRLLSNTGRATEAAEEYRQALALQRKLAEDHPAVTRFRSRLALSYHNLGILLKSTGRSAEAEAEFRRALALRQELADNNPAIPQFRRDLASTLVEIGRQHLQAGQAAEAIADFAREEAIRRGLVEGGAATPDDRDALANCRTDLAEVLRRTGRLDEALAASERSLAVREPLVAEHPGVPVYRAHLGASYLRLGLVRRDRGELAAAADAWKRACAQFPRDAPPDGAHSFVLACCHAGLATLAGRADSVMAAEEGTSHAATAMALLRRAVAMGYHDPDAYRTESGLDPLRDRPDFRVLMMDLAFPAEPLAR